MASQCIAERQGLVIWSAASKPLDDDAQMNSKANQRKHLQQWDEPVGGES